MMSACNPKKRTQVGIALFETLVASAILAIGLTGLAGLQLTSKVSRLESTQRVQATLIANAIVEKIRNNSMAIDAYDKTIVGVGLDTPQLVDCVNTTVCSAEQLAKYDIWTLHQQLVGASLNSQESTGKTANTGLDHVRACIFVDGNYVRVVVNYRSRVATKEKSASSAYWDSACPNAFTGTDAMKLQRPIIVNAYISQAD